MANKKKLVVDIDGTLARIVNKADYPFTTPEGLDEFNYACDTCEVIKPIVEMVQCLEPFYDVVLLTARTELSRDATMCWLLDNEILNEPFELIMRPETMFDADEYMKNMMLFMAGYSPSDVALVIDDSSKVIDFLRISGYNCIQVKDNEEIRE